MKCDWVKDNIVFYVYNELEDDARYEVEQHLARCTDCTAELKSARKFHTTLSQAPVTEPSPNLLAARVCAFRKRSRPPPRAASGSG